MDGEDHLFSENFACVDCGISYAEIAPRMFSFNSPYGACHVCNGLGTVREIDSDLIVPNSELSLNQGAIEPWGEGREGWYFTNLKALAQHFNFNLDMPWKNLDDQTKHIILYGTEKEIRVNYTSTNRKVTAEFMHQYEGIVTNLSRRYKQTNSSYIREWIESYMNVKPCETCGGSRLKPESLAIKIKNLSIAEVTRFSIQQAYTFFQNLKFTKREQTIAF